MPGVDSGGNIRNLGYVGADIDRRISTSSCSTGRHRSQGMPDFTGKLNADDVEKIKAFIQGVADSIRPKEPAAAGSK